MKVNYVLLNDQVFIFSKRRSPIETIGGPVERLLGGNATQDWTADKKKWTFIFDLEDIDLIRLQAIHDTHTIISLTDYNGILYSVIWVNNFDPDEYMEDLNEITVELVES